MTFYNFSLQRTLLTNLAKRPEVDRRDSARKMYFQHQDRQRARPERRRRAGVRQRLRGRRVAEHEGGAVRHPLSLHLQLEGPGAPETCQKARKGNICSQRIASLHKLTKKLKMAIRG